MGSMPRFSSLANLPIYFEYEADGIGDTDAIKGTYLDNYRAMWDLYAGHGIAIHQGEVLAGELPGQGGAAEVIAVVLGASGTVYYLNFKPEQDPDWQELAKLYTQETGVVPLS